MKPHKMQDGPDLVAGFFVNTEIILLFFQQIFGLDYFTINLMVTCYNSRGFL